jgi:hypothetical protein
MNPITIPNISIPTIGIPTIGIPSVGFPSASGGGGLVWPAGMKEHIKAWYDPKKQGMTNYDVIEAYVEDFTNWNYVKARGVATISQHKFIITECILKGLSIVEDIQEPYSNLTVRIIGITDNQEVLITDYVNGQHQIINTITEDGIYTIEDRSHFVGFGCNFVGTCNITIEQLPTSILKDLSGNGNHAYLYGGKGKLNSGMGVYEVDFTTYYGDVINSYTGRLTSNNKKNLGIAYNKLTKDIEPYTVKVTGIRKETVRFTYRNEEGIEKDILIKNDGYYTVPKCYKDGTQGSSTTFVLFANYDNDTEVIIEQIPDYPDQLCYDGKMYAVAYDMPILTDYTVMAERTWFEKEEYSAFISNSLGDMEAPSNGAFSVELKSLNSFTTISFGSITSIGIPEKGITYQTKQSYNGNSINVGTKESNDILILGGRYFYKNDNAAGNTWTGCHGAIIVADRSFTEEEINWLKQNWDKI